MFEIYKKGQGTTARWIAAASMGALAAFGTYELYDYLSAGGGSFHVGTVEVAYSLLVSILVVLGAAVLIFWLVNLPKFVDYLIMSEIELRKVSWPTREELKRQTMVVIIALIAFSLVLWIADLIFTTGILHLYKTK
ncbi:MAG: preprotein translocase subunit SecE [Candidatus Brocadiia bacterium]